MVEYKLIDYFLFFLFLGLFLPIIVDDFSDLPTINTQGANDCTVIARSTDSKTSFKTDAFPIFDVIISKMSCIKVCKIFDRPLLHVKLSWKKSIDFINIPERLIFYDNLLYCTNHIKFQRFNT